MFPWWPVLVHDLACWCQSDQLWAGADVVAGATGVEEDCVVHGFHSLEVWTGLTVVDEVEDVHGFHSVEVWAGEEGFTLELDDDDSQTDQAVDVGLTLELELDSQTDQAVDVGLTLLEDAEDSQTDQAVDVGFTLDDDDELSHTDQAVEVGLTLVLDELDSQTDHAVEVDFTLELEELLLVVLQASHEVSLVLDVVLVVEGVVELFEVVQFSHCVLEDGVVVVVEDVVDVVFTGVVVVVLQTCQSVVVSLRGRTPAKAPLAAARAMNEYLTMVMKV